MILAVSQRLQLKAENSIITASKLVGKVLVRSKIERNTNPRKKKENNSVKVLKYIYIYIYIYILNSTMHSTKEIKGSFGLSLFLLKL